MEWRRREDLRGEFKRVERGWCLGGEEFRQELLEQVDARPGPSHFGEAVQEAEGAQAERLVVEGLKRLRWTEADLRARRKGERGKVQFSYPLGFTFFAAPLDCTLRRRIFERAYD